MRNTILTLTAFFILAYSQSALAEAVDFMGSGHGSTCAEAKANLADLIMNGPADYTTEQAQTRQFPTGPAAVAYCQSRGASAPFATLPDEILANQYFPLPTEIIDVTERPCSHAFVDGRKVFGVGWNGASACNM